MFEAISQNAQPQSLRPSNRFFSCLPIRDHSGEVRSFRDPASIFFSIDFNGQTHSLAPLSWGVSFPIHWHKLYHATELGASLKGPRGRHSGFEGLKCVKRWWLCVGLGWPKRRMEGVTAIMARDLPGTGSTMSQGPQPRARRGFCRQARLPKGHKNRTFEGPQGS